MSYRKKFRVPKLKSAHSFAESAEPILAHYVRRALKYARRYLADETVENLHELRIALRRFRYVLELYAGVLKEARFEKVYAMAVGLQNVLGERRDVDVMQANLLHIYRGEAVPSVINDDLERRKAALRAQIETALTEFIRNKHIEKLAERES